MKKESAEKFEAILKLLEKAKFNDMSVTDIVDNAIIFRNFATALKEEKDLLIRPKVDAMPVKEIKEKKKDKKDAKQPK